MALLNSNIEEYLSYYLSLPVKPGYAILLRGRWGCGKSWFMKDYISKNPYSGYLYVSLYGITSYKEIEDSFFEQLHPVLASKGMKLVGKIFKGLLKTTIKVDLNNDGKEDGNITSSIPDINLPDYLKNVDSKILVFDDLERCSISIPNILGYINQFVETNGLKVIILANEEEIIKNEKDNPSTETNRSYALIKEKLIGRSFEVLTDFESAINDFVSEPISNELSQLLQTKKVLLKELFDTAGYNNLRHLRQSILDFNRFYSYISAKAKSHTDLIDHIISLFFAISFELKKGEISEKEISQLFFTLFFNPDKEPVSAADRIRKKYSVFNLYYFPISEHLWTEYFINGHLDKSQVEASIENSYYFKDEKTPNWIKLWYYFDLDDDEFESIYAIVYKEFDENNIQEKYQIVQITALFLSFSTINLIPVTKKKIVEIGKRNFDRLKNENKLKLNKNETFQLDASHGLGYMNIKDVDFQGFLNYAIKKVESSQKQDYDILAEGLLKKLEESVDLFEQEITLNNSSSSTYYNTPILKYIPLAKFTETFNKLKNKDKKRLSWALQKRYDHIFDELKEERPWIIKLKKALEKQMKSHPEKVSSKIIEFSFLRMFDRIIKALK